VGKFRRDGAQILMWPVQPLLPAHPNRLPRARQDEVPMGPGLVPGIVGYMGLLG